MRTSLHIINAALRKMGGRRVMALTEEYEPLRLALDALPDVVDLVLRDHAWSHAMRWVSLARSASESAFGYTFTYMLPQDCVRLIDVRARPAPDAPLAHYAVAGSGAGQIICTNAKPAYARYVARMPTSRMEDVAYWPQDFAEAVSCRLAAEIAVLGAQDSRLPVTLLQMYNLALDTARLNDAATCNEISTPSGTCDFLLARQTYNTGV